VYGSIEQGSFSETDMLTPRSPYSAAKAGSDLIALSYHTTHGLPVLVTRCSNNFGPYQFPEKVIPLFTTNLLDGEKVPLYGDGGNIRDWIHVHDHNTAVDLVLRAGTVGEIYNIGAGNEITNRELTYRLLALTGRDESFIEPVADRLGHDRRYSITHDKISALGWKTEHNLDDGLAATVEWYGANREWWEPLKARAGF
ncbi:MAG TPA: GDP-mannose 4,6-dehydratase, partial [Ilumatobacteraceae bacterium]